MKARVKRCIECKTLLSNSSKTCIKCGSRNLDKGFYTDESNKNKSKKSLEESVYCPTCHAPLSKNSRECGFCGDEIYMDGEGGIITSFYQEEIDRRG